MLVNWFNKIKMRKELKGCNYKIVTTRLKNNYSSAVIQYGLAELFTQKNSICFLLNPPNGSSSSSKKC